MAADVKTTEYYAFPLSWDKFTTDRKLIEEAFKKIDLAIHNVSGGSANNSENVTYETPEGDIISVAASLDTLFQRIKTFDIAVSATGGADVNETIWSFTASLPFRLPADLDGTQAVIKPLSAPVDLIINVTKNDIVVGSINIDDNEAIYSFPIDTDFAIGDAIGLVATSSVTFKAIAITLQAIRLD